jgi:hypothetical protein
MPTNSQVLTSIESRFDSNWDDDSVEVRYEQDRRKRPSINFIRLTVRTLGTQEMGIAGSKILYRRQSSIVMQCFTIVGNGTKLAKDIADRAVAIFEGKQFAEITCRESSIRELGDDGKGFYQVNATVFFDFDLEVSTN